MPSECGGASNKESARRNIREGQKRFDGKRIRRSLSRASHVGFQPLDDIPR